ncbi:hypothetical protein B0F90DRAFT_1666333 [Multifurca ochricompacta]|uniref:Uncharacterized protein n=1 Tax=Multifurca ochricompacta TaxID=376703 RepID=A0AAD4M7Y2_9AGAM|nr:hypothetical protein B0F90DRAFT_1666333 [Multifurca ochricompacta]
MGASALVQARERAANLNIAGEGEGKREKWGGEGGRGKEGGGGGGALEVGVQVKDRLTGRCLQFCTTAPRHHDKIGSPPIRGSGQVPRGRGHFFCTVRIVNATKKIGERAVRLPGETSNKEIDRGRDMIKRNPHRREMEIILYTNVDAVTIKVTAQRVIQNVSAIATREWGRCVT